MHCVVINFAKQLTTFRVVICISELMYVNCKHQNSSVPHGAITQFFTLVAAALCTVSKE
jgi:hypothetical protein